MKTVINIILGIVLVVLIGAIILYRPPVVEQAMKEENLTVVKAPAQTESIAHPDFIKEVYVPVIPEGTNLALEGKVDASGFESTYTPRKVIDGNAGGVSYWEGAKDSYPNLLSVDLAESKTVHAVRILLNPQNIWGKREQTFSVAISADGETFTEVVPEAVYAFDPDQGNEAVVEFDPVAAQYVQLSFTANTGAGGGQVAEFEIYGE